MEPTGVGSLAHTMDGDTETLAFPSSFPGWSPNDHGLSNVLHHCCQELSAPQDQKSWGKNLSSQEPKCAFSTQIFCQSDRKLTILCGQNIQSQFYGEKAFPDVLFTVRDYGEKRVLSGAG